jgi:hypothetical protein
MGSLATILGQFSVPSHLSVDEFRFVDVEDEVRRPDSAPPHYTKDELFVQPLKLNAAAGLIKKGKSKHFITSIGTKIYGAGPWPFFHIVRLDATLPHSTLGGILFFAALCEGT